MNLSLSKLTFLLGFVFAARLTYGADALDSWTDRSISGVTSDLRATTYGNGTFVAVGLGGTIVASSDGANWTAQTSPTSSDLYCVTYGNGVFVAAGNGNTVVTSPDGTNWTATVVASWNVPISALAFGNGKFVAAGYVEGVQGHAPGTYIYSNVLASSSDGKNWTPAQSIRPTTPFGISAVAYLNGEWWLGGYFINTPYPEANFVTVFGTSSDSLNWTITTNSMTIEPYTIAFGNGVYAGEGLSSATGLVQYEGAFEMTFSSMDSSSWSYQLGYTFTIGPGVLVKFLNNQFEAVGVEVTSGGKSAAVASSVDAATWVYHYLPTNSSPLAVSFGNTCYVAVGVGGMIYQSASLLGGSTNGGALFQPLHLTAGGVIQGTLSGSPGTYAVQSSADLATWTLLTNLTLSAPTGTFYDSTSNSLNARFYRATGP